MQSQVRRATRNKDRLWKPGCACGSPDVLCPSMKPSKATVGSNKIGLFRNAQMHLQRYIYTALCFNKNHGSVKVSSTKQSSIMTLYYASANYGKPNRGSQVRAYVRRGACMNVMQTSTLKYGCKTVPCTDQ